MKGHYSQKWQLKVKTMGLRNSFKSKYMYHAVCFYLTQQLGKLAAFMEVLRFNSLLYNILNDS